MVSDNSDDKSSEQEPRLRALLLSDRPSTAGAVSLLDYFSRPSDVRLTAVSRAEEFVSSTLLRPAAPSSENKIMGAIILALVPIVTIAEVRAELTLIVKSLFIILNAAFTPFVVACFFVPSTLTHVKKLLSTAINTCIIMITLMFPLWVEWARQGTFLSSSSYQTLPFLLCVPLILSLAWLFTWWYARKYNRQVEDSRRMEQLAESWLACIRSTACLLLLDELGARRPEPTARKLRADRPEGMLQRIVRHLIGPCGWGCPLVDYVKSCKYTHRPPQVGTSGAAPRGTVRLSPGERLRPRAPHTSRP